MMIAPLLIGLQILISGNTATVSFVDGPASVSVREQVPEGGSIETGADSHAEVLLSNDLFLRIGPNSKVLLDALNRDVHVQLIAATFSSNRLRFKVKDRYRFEAKT